MIVKKNDEIIECLAEIMLKLDIEKRKYQTDIYAYYNPETCMLILKEFENPGGNSWIDDDHGVIYVDHEHFESIFDSDFFDETRQLLEALDMSIEELVKEVAAEDDDLEEDMVDEHMIYDYVKSKREYVERLEEVYAYLLRDCDFDYYLDMAECYLEEFKRAYGMK